MSLRVEGSSPIHQVNTPKIPFPGNGADFVLSSGDWKIETNLFYPMRFLSFSSKTPGSLFTDLRVAGNQDGSIGFSVSCRSTCKKIAENYFTKMQIPFDNFLSAGVATTLAQRMTLFKILSENNTIPEEHFHLIEDLSHAGNWHQVTPLEPEEQQLRQPSEKTNADWDTSREAALEMLSSMNEGNSLKLEDDDSIEEMDFLQDIPNNLPPQEPPAPNLSPVGRLFKWMQSIFFTQWS
jgi:hypothetical protein